MLLQHHKTFTGKRFQNKGIALCYVGGAIAPKEPLVLVLMLLVLLSASEMG